MKTGRTMPEVRSAIEAAGLTEHTMLVQNCGLPGQQICRSLGEASRRHQLLHHHSHQGVERHGSFCGAGSGAADLITLRASACCRTPT